MVRLINYLKGYVRIKVWGGSVERFINLCGNKNLLIWDVTRDGEIYEMYISLSAFYELRSIARKTLTRIVIIERCGLPFILPGLKKRMVFALCCLAAIFFWYGSSLFLWDVDFEGNYRLTEEVFMDFLEEQNVRIGMFSGKLDIELLEKEMRKHFPEITWVSMKREGTRLIISVKENDAPIIDSTDLLKQENVGMDLIADYDGTIVSMIVRKGVPKVSVGDEVTAGTVLVEGRIPVLNEDASIREYLYVEADADILLEHELMYEDNLAVHYREKMYTGRERCVYFCRWDQKEFSLEARIPFLLYDMTTRFYQPVILDKLSIPLYTGEKRYREYYYLEKKYSEMEADKLLDAKLEEFINSLEEKGVQIIEKDVKINKDSDSWIKSGIFTIIEEVKMFQPTVIEKLEDNGEDKYE